MTNWDGKERRSGWSAQQAMILNEIERVNNMFTSLERKFDNQFSKLESKFDELIRGDMVSMKVEIATLKVKAAMIAAICGAAPAILMLLLGFFKR